MAPSPDPRLPPHAPGMRVGLFGGSFDPPHPGHLMVTELALRRLRLDRVWWLVSPANPLKPRPPRASLGARIAAAKTLLGDRRVVVTGIEAAIGSRYSADTVAWLKARLPGISLVWLLGADAFAGFHRWRRWRAIAATLPIAVVDRPGSTFSAASAPAARALAKARIPERRAADLADLAAPAWVLIHGPRVAISSTMIRGDDGDRANLS